MPQKADLFRVYRQETSVVFRRAVQLGSSMWIRVFDLEWTA